MDVNELSSAWRAAGQVYAAAVNEFVERGMREGWPDKDPTFPDGQTPLASAVLKVVREANRDGKAGTLREKFPPAAHPFTNNVKSEGRALDPVIWIDDTSVALRI